MLLLVTGNPDVSVFDLNPNTDKNVIQWESNG